jgi:hypothetical protein
MGGESLQLVIEEGLRKAKLATPPPLTAAGAVERLGRASQAGMEGEVQGQGLAQGARAILGPFRAPFKSQLEPYAQEAVQTFQGKVLPSEISKSRVLNVAENVAEGSFLGGGQVTAVKEARQLVAEARAHGVLGSLGPRKGARGTGAAVQSAREQALKAFRGAEKQAWEQEFRPLAEQIPAKSPRLDAFIGELEGRQAGAILPNAGLTAARRVASLAPEAETVVYGGREVPLTSLPATVQEAITQVGATPPTTQPLTAYQFQQTVSDLGKLVRALDEAAVRDPTKNNQLGLAKKLYGLALGDMAETLAGSPKAQTAYASARALTKFGNARLMNEEIRKLADLAPEKLVSAVVKPNNSTAVEAVRQAVDPATFQTVQAEALKRLLRANARTGSVNWGQVAQRLDTLGEDTRGALFPKGHDREIQRIAQLMLRLNEKPAGGIGRIAVQLGQGGAAVGLVTGVMTPASATILLTPAVLARVFASPTGLQWLSEGLQAAPGSASAMRAAAQLLTFAQVEPGVEEESQVGAPPPRAQGPGPTRGVGGAPPLVR